MSNTSYIVRLADNSEWQIIPSPETVPVVALAAEIMGLRPGASSSARRLFVARKNAGGSPSATATAPDGSWHAKTIGYGTFWFDEKGGDVVLEMLPTDSYVKIIRQVNTLLFPLIDGAVDSGGLPVHAGLLARDGHGMILPATGNTGKSTCCRRIAPPWHSPGDDFGLIVKAGGRDYRVHPLPTWSNFFYHRPERRWRIEDNYPLSGIFFLEQGARDEVRPIRRTDAAARLFDRACDTLNNYMRINSETYKSARLRFFENACAISRIVPSYVLKASLTGQFWTGIEQAMGMV